MSDSARKGNAFEEEVEQLLRLKGYTVKRNELINGTQIDLIAEKKDLLNNLVFVVECTDRNNTVGVPLVKEKASVLLSLKSDSELFSLIFISQNGFTAKAKAFANSQPNVILLTPTDLESDLIDFEPYFNWYSHNYRNSKGIFGEGNLFKHYIELKARDEQNKNVSSITEEVKQWLNNSSNNLLFLLGEFGSGKTSFCRQLVYELLQEKFSRQENQKSIPILINLREHRGAAPNLQQVITDTLINRYGVQIQSFLAFERICSSGRILLLLDGFDEMSDTSEKEALIDCFNQIYILAGLNAKILLTCRSNFFRSHSDVIELLKHFSINIPLSENTDDIVQLPFKDHGRVLYIEKLTKTQIHEFIAKRFGSDAESILKEIESIHDLSDLSTRPVLLDMILTTLPELSKVKKNINSAALYEHYTNKWTARDDWRVKMPLKIRQAFCEILGWVIQNEKIQEIDYSILEHAMVQSLEKIAKNRDELGKFKNELQTCSFLVRVSNQDKFRFAHKSFLEYFVAKKIIHDLSKGFALSKPDFGPPMKELTTPSEKKKSVETNENTDSLGFNFAKAIFKYVDNPRFSSIYDSLTQRVQSSDGFVSLRRSEFFGDQIDGNEDVVVRGHIESEIRSVISNQELSEQSESFGISEEIATFAIEVLDNARLSLRKFVSNLKDDDSTIIFSDILRLGKSSSLVEKNEKFIRKYIKTGESEILRISFCVSLLRIPNSVDIDFIKEIRKFVDETAWSYLLFELADCGGAYQNILSECFEMEDLSTIDKVICAYGSRKSLKKDSAAFIDEALISGLLRSSKEKEVLLGLALCRSEALPTNKVLKFVKEVIGEQPSKDIKQEAILVLSSLDGKTTWQFARTLWSNETDPKFKELLKNVEQQLRDENSRSARSLGQQNSRPNTIIKDKMWKSLRR